MISSNLSSTTRTVSNPAPVTAMQSSKTATDLEALAPAAGTATLTAPTGKQRSVRQAQQLASNTSANSNINYQSSNTATSLAKTARAQVMGPSGAHHPSATKRTAARPLHPQTRGKPTLYKSMDSRRSQRRHRSSPHSRTARGTRSSLSNHSG